MASAVDAASPDEAAGGWTAAARVVWLPTADEMAGIDRHAVASGATSERVLIETAGREVARQIQTRHTPGRAVALAGSGHNGADALVALRTLRTWGWDVVAVQCGSRPPEPDVTAGWELQWGDVDALADACRNADVILDGLLGTGARGAPRGRLSAIIEEVNALDVERVAVDGPSGVDFTTGTIEGACIRADLTVTLGWPKLGLLMYPARRHCGELVAVEIGFPPPHEAPGARAITGRWAGSLLHGRAADAHKGDAGYVTVVAGQEGMAGAAILAGRAASRAGAGIVRIVSDPTNREIIQEAVPDAVFAPWDSDEAVRESVAWADAIVLGPGLGRGDERRRLAESVLEARDGRPVLIDADGLSAWAGDLADLAARLRPSDAITPHPGELGRLLGVEATAIQENRVAVARSTAETLGCAVLLKGAPSLLAAAGELRVSTTGGLALAAGGSGDVLSGASGAFLAAGYAAPDAVSVALFLTGAAAEISAHSIGHTASDVPDRIPAVRATVEGLGLPRDPAVLFRSTAPPA